MQNEKRYPFKYLDAYSQEDKDIYFGRDAEVKELYDLTHQSDLVLVYGASGTGKTSLIQCGLANCFESYAWLDLPVKYGTNINRSLEKALIDKIGEDLDYFNDEPDEENENENENDHSQILRLIKILKIKYFKPIYLIFDQFEELYTIEKDDAERLKFYKTVKEILALNQPVKIIISMREEYLGHLNDFEREVPDILRKKLRIEPMEKKQVRQVLMGINDPEKSIVTLREGEEETLVQAIFDKLREGKISIELPYLQVLLDKLYREKTKDEQEKPTTPTTLNLDDLKQLGNIGDILFDMLNGLVSQLEKKGVNATTVWNTLSRFVTEAGTKKPVPLNAVQQNDQHTVDFFVDKRILRYDDKEDVYEIIHDTLASKIDDKRSDEERTKLQIEDTIKNTVKKPENLRETFSEKLLNQIDLYLDKLEIDPQGKKWIEQSRKKLKKQKRKMTILVCGAFTVISMLCLFFFQQWLRSEKLINAFYFYDGKFALAYKNDNFYFIDKEGDPVDTLGSWKQAEQFNKYTGLAKVINAQNQTYLLDTLGNKYRYADNISILDDYRIRRDIQILDLSNTSLESLPPEIGLLTNLIRLDLSNTQLESLPPEIGKLTNLTRLDLSNTKLENLPPEIRKLTNLASLNLYNTQLESLPPEIGQLTNLTRLDLSSTQLESLPPEIGKLTNLARLNLYNTQLESFPPEILKLTNLTYLSLGNKFKSLPPEIGKLTNLTSLWLDGKFKSLPPEIGQLTNLTFLSLSGKLENLPPEIGKLTNLTSLSLNGKLENLPPEIGKLTNLTYLSLGKTQLESLPPEIGQLTNLTSLYLSNTKLESLPPEIGKLTNLTSLILSGKLESLPPEIGKLTNLTFLWLDGKFKSLPPEIGKLKNLQSFSCNCDLLNEESKKIAEKLQTITENTSFSISIKADSTIKIIKNAGVIKKEATIYNKKKELIQVRIYNRKQTEARYVIFKGYNKHFAFWRNGFMTKNNIYSFYIETKYEIPVYVLIAVGFLGGIFFRTKKLGGRFFCNKKRIFWGRLCWSVFGTVTLFFVVLYGYLLLV